MKKDILAAVTFLVTGLLFYTVQTDGQGDRLYSSSMDCPVHETVLVKQAAPEAETQILLDEGATRDS